MALVVEDGSGLEAATSYVSVDEAVQFLAARGLVLKLNKENQSLILALDEIESLKYSGVKFNSKQSLVFPRTGIRDEYGIEMSSRSMLVHVKRAQIWAAYYISQGNDLSAVPGPVVESEKIDSLEIRYVVNNNQSTDSTSLLDLPNVARELRQFIYVQTKKSSSRTHRA